MQDETLKFDILIVGGGPAGLAAAIRAKQLARAAKRDISVCVIEKGAVIGAHILSGAILDPISLAELFPDWQRRKAPLQDRVTHNRFLFLNERRAYAIPEWLLPPVLANEGCYFISLGELCRWLATQAETEGVEVFSGFVGTSLLTDTDGAICGIRTGDKGLQKDGQPGPAWQPGIGLEARYTLFAEGCRGNLAAELESRFQLRHGCDPQTFNLGIKELWEIPYAQHQAGLAMHTACWPLADDVYGGGFIYHYGLNLVSIGLNVGLSYANPWMSPFEEFQRFKTHPGIRPMLAGGRRIGYGARTTPTGGLQSLPRLVFPGGALLGDSAGLLNAARLKGIHTALKSGMLAAEAACAAIFAGRRNDVLEAYPQALRQSWVSEELFRARNFKPGMAGSTLRGSLLFALDQYIFGGSAPWTFRNTADHAKLMAANDAKLLHYPPPDGEISFDRDSSLLLANLRHTETQAPHLVLRKPDDAIGVNYARYKSPEQRYCPAGVYEVLDTEGTPRLAINAGNCLHCKACDIKDPGQNIQWQAPQGGDGPLYERM